METFISKVEISLRKSTLKVPPAMGHKTMKHPAVFNHGPRPTNPELLAYKPGIVNLLLCKDSNVFHIYKINLFQVDVFLQTIDRVSPVLNLGDFVTVDRSLLISVGYYTFSN